jgi:transcriptional regulator with XRE-family HTH domain
VNVGERIRILRERKGLSQKRLAHELDMPNQSLSNYERGYRLPTPEVLKKIADFFEVSVDYLLGRESFIYHANSPRNLKEFIERGNFTYDEVVLEEEDMKKIRQMIELIIDYKKKAQSLEKKENDGKDTADSRN